MTTEQNQANKKLVWELWQALDSGDLGRDAVETAMAPDLIWHGPAPVGRLDGADRFWSDFWSPLKRSFPDLARRTHLFFGGESNGRVDGDRSRDGRQWVTGTGVFDATFTAAYLGIPATGRAVEIRWGEFCRLDQGRVVEVFFLIDIVDLMAQAGHDPLPPSRGRPGLYPGPEADDGLLHSPQPDTASTYSLEHIRRFIFEGLNAYDETELASMGMAQFFHPEVKWYGPGGIGACLSLTEFEDLHQQPWLVAFPDRQVQDLDALLAEGAYSGGPGWAGVVATHTGPYLSAAATGNRVEINGLDWWKRDGEMYVENWVFVDMIHLFDQFGIDLLGGLPTANRAR